MAAFGKTFAAARKAGKKTFEWQGKSYTTKLKSENESSGAGRGTKPDIGGAIATTARAVADIASPTGSHFEVATGPTSPETALPRPRPDTGQTASTTPPTAKEVPPIAKHPPNATVATRPAGESPAVPYTGNTTPNPAAATIAASEQEAADRAAAATRVAAEKATVAKKFPKGFSSSRNRFAGR